MATLTDRKISETYKDLLQVSNTNTGIDATKRAVEDGEGTASPLELSSAAVNVSSGFEIGGVALSSSAAELNRLDGTLTTVRTTLGVAIGSDVQAWAASTDTLASGDPTPLDGDIVDITWSPTNYTRDSSIPEASVVTDLSAHLKGIDTALVAGGEAGEWFSFETGHTNWADGLIDEEIHRMVAPAGTTITIDRIEFQQKGGGTSGQAAARVVEDPDVTPIQIGTVTLGAAATESPGASADAATVVVDLSNSTGAAIDASVRVVGRFT